MRTSLRLVLAALVAFATFVAPASAEHHEGAKTFTVDTAHSDVSFSIRHILTPVRGNFGDFTGTIVYNAETPSASSVEMTVQAKSIDTSNEKRDDHLRSADFFDVANHPTLSFVSKSVEAKGDKLHVTGDFTLHGVTKEITIPVEVLGVMDTPMGTKGGFHTRFEIDRTEYGVIWNRALNAGGAILGETVKIDIAIEADLVIQDKATR